MIYPYKTGSSSAKALAAALEMKLIRREHSKFKGKPDKVVINWGCSNVPDEVEKCVIINRPEQVEHATNKLSFFRTLDGEVSLPEWTDKKEVAQSWADNNETVVARTVLTGNSGNGIVLVGPEHPEELPQASLYTKYIPKKHEYRVHIVAGKVIDVAKKSTRQGSNPACWKVRSYANGFIFTRGNLGEVHSSVTEESLKAISILGLDFGAVDVIFNEHRGKAYVLEVNTAPGLEGTTVESYQQAFKELLLEVYEEDGVNKKDFKVWFDTLNIEMTPFTDDF